MSKRTDTPSLVAEMIDIDALKLDPRNARSHAKGIPELAASLSEFGQRKPVVVWGDNLVVAGNGAVMAARSLEWKQIEIVRVPDDWDYNKARAFALVDNKTAELSEWDVPVLDDIRLSLDESGWDLERFGFEAITIPFALDDQAIDEIGELPDAPRSKVGDVWMLGEHRLVCGDSTKPETYALLMADDKADCVWTDPPYGVEYVGKTKKALTIKNDGADGLSVLLSSAFGCWADVSIPGAAVYVAHPAGALSLTFLQCFVDQGWRLHETLCWNKQTIVMGHSDYHYSHEPILYGYMNGGGRRGRGGAGWYGDNAQKSVIDVAKPSRSEAHPTMKPVALVSLCLVNSSPAHGIVLDPFAGSGSTLIASEQIGRRCRAIELDPRYVDVIVDRWETLTGHKAELQRT